MSPMFISHCQCFAPGRQGRSETSFSFQIVLDSNRMHHPESIRLARSLPKFLRTTMNGNEETSVPGGMHFRALNPSFRVVTLNSVVVLEEKCLENDGL
jgi:hypothetical protein